MIKKIITFITFLSLLLLVVSFGPSSFAADYTNWTLDGDYYYYDTITTPSTLTQGMVIADIESPNGQPIYYKLADNTHYITENLMDDDGWIKTRSELDYDIPLLPSLKITANYSEYYEEWWLTVNGQEYVKADEMFILTESTSLVDLDIRVSASTMIEDPTPIISTGYSALDLPVYGIWHRELSERVYAYLRYARDANIVSSNEDGDPYETNATNHYINSVSSTAEDNWLQPGQTETVIYTLNNPDSEVYNSFKLVKSDSITETTMYSGAATTLTVEITYYPVSVDDHIYLDFYVDDILIASLNGEDSADKIKAYWETIDEYVPINPGDPVLIDDLPNTTGNPYNINGEWGYVTYTVNHATHEVLLSVVYDGVNYALDPIILENIEFLVEDNTASYYTYNNEQYIYFSYDDIDVLRRSQYTEQSGYQWGGYAVWNLTQSEVSVLKKVTVKTYVSVDENHDAFAYFYTPDVIMDHLMSVTVSFRYRWGNLFDEGYSDWEDPELVTLQDDQQTTSITTWEQALFTTSVAATVATATWMSYAIAASASPPLWPLLVVGGLTAGIATAFGDNITGFRLESFDQIEQEPSISPTLLDELESVYGASINLSINSPKKLYLGQYQKAWSSGVDFDADTFNYVELVWKTNGDVYVMSDNEIITEIPTFDYPETSDPDTSNILGNIISSLGAWFYVIIVVLIVILIGAIAKPFSNGLSSIKRLVTNHFGVIIFALLLIAIILLTGIFSI